jgi:hypothetical protein
MAVLTTKNLRNRLGIEDNQELPMFAWPGGYPVTYYVSDDTDRPERHDGTLCGKCVNDEDFGHIVFAFDIEEEDTDETCDHCGCFLDNPTRDPATSKRTGPTVGPRGGNRETRRGATGRLQGTPDPLATLPERAVARYCPMGISPYCSITTKIL